MNKLIKLALFVIASEVVGNIGAIFTIKAIPTWYASLIKPGFNPPNWLFGPVWVTLFALMGISAYLVFERGMERRAVKVALGIFGIQFALNLLWDALFFGLHAILFGLIDIIVLWVAIAVTVVLFYRISRLAGMIMLPYIFWVTIATLLNYFIYVLN